MIPAFAVLVLALLLTLLGTRLPGLAGPRDGSLHRAVTGALAGAVIFHLLMTLFDAIGLRWSALRLGIALVLVLALLAGAAARFRDSARPDEEKRLPSDSGWGDEIALLTLAVFALLALSLAVTTPDFVFHWGLKGQRFFLARQVDYPFLAQSWGWTIHADYPNLLPELYAVSALAAGRFSPPALMLWSVFFFALLLAAAREALHEAEPFVRQAGIGLLAVLIGAFACGESIAGGADWMLALALVAAIPALSRPPDAAGDLQIGVAAAFAAGAKVEGVMLAGFLILAQLARRPAGGSRVSSKRLLRLGALAAAVAIPWYVQVRRHHLLSVLYADRLDWQRGRIIGPAVLKVMNGDAWHGFSYVILLLPLLALRRSTRRSSRPLAFAVGGQLLFYLWIYFVSAIDTRYYVVTSFPRLLFHLVPAVLVGVLAGWPAPPASTAHTSSP